MFQWKLDLTPFDSSVADSERLIIHGTMTGVIEEDEGLSPTTYPVVTDGMSQILNRLFEFVEVGVCNLKDIYGACTKSSDSFPHVLGVIFDLVNVLEFFISSRDICRAFA